MSKIEVNTVDVQCGSTLTLGSSGKTVTLATGASQTGFGRTGTVNWCTTAKTSPLTVASGNGYFINTSGGAVTVTLPASPSAGDIVAFKDYANTWDTNSVTLGNNGSKINGICATTALTTESQSVTLIYVDGTKGWQDIHDSTANISGNPGFIAATGGTITTSGDFKIHTFTSSGCFAVTNSGSTSVGSKVSYAVVAGAGSGGASSNGNQGAAGGAGGFREGKQTCGGYTASPLAATPCSGLSVSIQTYPITVGAGGASTSGDNIGNVGSNSIFSTITSAGGGYGGSGNPIRAGGDGGSGGGGGGGTSATAGGSGNTPPVSPPQGNDGGTSRPGPGPSYDQATGGGGGAGGAGSPSPNGAVGGAGGAHINTSINAVDTEYAGGAGGSSGPAPGAAGTPGGGGAGKGNPGPGGATAGTANTGGSGGGEGCGNTSGAGGSGVVIIRYKFQ